MSARQTRLPQTSPADQPADPGARATATFDSMVDTMTKPSKTSAGDQLGALPSNRAGQEPGRPGDTLRAALLGASAPFAAAYAAYRAEAARIEEIGSAGGFSTNEESWALIKAKDEAFAAAVRAPDAFHTLPDAIAAAGYLQDYVNEDDDTWNVPAELHPIIADGLHAFLSGLLDSAQALEGSTIISELGMTFTEALERWRELGRAAEVGDAINLASAILAAEPATPADALVLLELLADPETGLAAGDAPHDAEAIQRAFAILSRAPTGIVANTSADAELLDLWRQYLPLKVRANATPFDSPDEAGAAHLAPDALERRMAAIPARSPVGMAVKLGVLWQLGGAALETWDGRSERITGAVPESDYCVRWLWMILNEARALGAPMPLVPDDQTADSHMAAALSRGLVVPGDANIPVAYTPEIRNATWQDGQQDDAELLAAYADFCAYDRAYNLDPNAGKEGEEEREAKFAVWEAKRDRVANLPARTFAGLEVKALTALRINENASVNDRCTLARWDGYSKPPKVDEDPQVALLWDIVESARRLEASRSQTPHLDAELVEAATRWLDMLELDDPTPEQEAEADRLHDRIVALPARTAAGAVAKAAALTEDAKGCVLGLEEGDQLYPLLRSIEPTEESEPVAQLARRLARNIRVLDDDALAAELTITALRTGQRRPGRDDFAAAVETFQTEAPAALTIPTEPSPGMIAAAAAATGCSPERVRAGYAAMVAACRREAA